MPHDLLWAPALNKPDWLPEGLWDELDELCAEHGTFIHARETATNALHELQRRFEGEDKSLSAGESEEFTPKADRDDALKAARAKVDSTTAELQAFLRRAIRPSRSTRWSGKKTSGYKTRQRTASYKRLSR